MENFNIVLDYIARTNLFNFVIFLSIIIFLVKKVQVGTKLEVMQASINEQIDTSKIVKEESATKLHGIKKSLKNIEKEITSIIDTSETNAKLVGEKILQDAEKTALVIKENTEKAIENSQILLKNELLKKASLASIEVAKNHIIQELISNNELHDKLINESIEALEGVNQ
jgi:F0F1-type ATP synthase membrane subunit b/b'